MEVDVAHKYAVRGESWPLILNEIIARNELDNELGRFAEGPKIQYHLEQDTRDSLLAFAQRDAAEALLNTRTLLTEVHELKKSYNELVGQFLLLDAAYLFWAWWQSGFAMAEWVQWWNWFK